MEKFLEEAASQNHPLRILKEFLEKEESFEKSKQYDQMRFVGYVLDMGYDEIIIITSDPFKIAVGGVPRNSLLIMCPATYKNDNFVIPPHFTLLRVLDSASTPLSGEVQQTYFELQKKSMPELDVFTQSELQWGALKTGVLGMYYPHPYNLNEVEFSGDLNNFVSAHKYLVYAPDDKLLDLVNNSLVPNKHRFQIGKLRFTECRLPLPNKKQPDVDIVLSTDDFLGCRTAMFGKTRLGKSNVVKLIVQSLIETTKTTGNVGQLIFDINGEYANDNPQDDNRSIATAYPDVCSIYALTPKPNTPSKPLKLNFYENPSQSKMVLTSLLRDAGRTSGYIETFNSVELPVLGEVCQLVGGSDKIRATRKLQTYWAVLRKAGYLVDEAGLRKLAPTGKVSSQFNPGFKEELRNAAYNSENSKVPNPPSNLGELVRELEIIARFRRGNSYKKIFTFHNFYPNRIISRESGWLEFKESFNWGSKDGYAKTMAAFANNNGGYIVFGVKDSPKEIIGLRNNNFDNFDEAKMSGYINESFSPEIIFEKFVIQAQSRNIGILFIHKARYKPIICCRNAGILKESDIYYRYSGRSEKIKYPELKLIIEQALEDEKKSWWEHFEKISKIGTTNAAILDLNSGEINGHAGTLVIDKKLIPKLKFIKEGVFREGGKPVLKLIGDVKPVSITPVPGNTKYINAAAIKITNDLGAPIVRLAEEEFFKKYPIDYKSLIKNLHEKYSNFKVNNFFYNILKEFKENKRLCWIRTLNPNNPKSAKTYFYSLEVLEEFDKYYQNNLIKT